VALGHIYFRFAWQAWHLVTSTALCMAGVALGHIYFRFAWPAWHLVTSTFDFAWQAWHLWHWAGSGGAFGPGFGRR